MRPLQILINKYTTDKQDLEYKLEAELNSVYPNVQNIDNLIQDIVTLDAKNGYLTQILIDISHARNASKQPDNPNK